MDDNLNIYYFIYDDTIVIEFYESCGESYMVAQYYSHKEKLLFIDNQVFEYEKQPIRDYLLSINCPITSEKEY